MDWTRDLPTWSHPSLSRRIDAAPHRWHLQECGAGPTVLLLPGSGASVHTWRDLIPDLAQTHHVVALDLPGQGFTKSPGGARSGLPEMTADIAALLAARNWQPETIVSHSAGAAIALSLTDHFDVARIVGINPALDNFGGIAGWLFPALAKLLAINPATALLFTLSASPSRSKSLIRSTGSELTDEGYGFYARLMRDRDHVNGTLNMMARWSLDSLLERLPQIGTRTLFITGARDAAVPPSVANRAADRMPRARVVDIAGLGHLAHEEDPAQVLDLIASFLGD